MVCKIMNKKRCDGCGECYDEIIAEMQIETEIEEYVAMNFVCVPEISEGSC